MQSLIYDTEQSQKKPEKTRLAKVAFHRSANPVIFTGCSATSILKKYPKLVASMLLAIVLIAAVTTYQGPHPSITSFTGLLIKYGGSKIEEAEFCYV